MLTDAERRAIREFVANNPGWRVELHWDTHKGAAYLGVGCGRWNWLDLLWGGGQGCVRSVKLRDWPTENESIRMTDEFMAYQREVIAAIEAGK